MALTIRPDQEMLNELDRLQKTYRINTAAGIINHVVMSYQNLVNEKKRLERQLDKKTKDMKFCTDFLRRQMKLKHDEKELAYFLNTNQL